MSSFQRLPRLRVGRSAIHGRGLFARTALPKGLVLGRCQVRSAAKSGPYTLWSDHGRVNVTCDFRYINHSNTPNVVYYDDFTVVTLRKIKAGEELTHDYAGE